MKERFDNNINILKNSTQRTFFDQYKIKTSKFLNNQHENRRIGNLNKQHKITGWEFNNNPFVYNKQKT